MGIMQNPLEGLQEGLVIPKCVPSKINDYVQIICFHTILEFDSLRCVESATQMIKTKRMRSRNQIAILFKQLDYIQEKA